MLVEDEPRTRQVIADVLAALSKDRNCLVLTNRTSHLEGSPACCARPGTTRLFFAAGWVPRAALRAEQRAFRLAEMRRRLGITQAQVAARMGVTQGRVSVIEHAKPGATELRTLAAYVEALGGRLEIIADFGDQRLAFTEPGTEAA
jgi:DNA-binding XRE family transcriptional regulator